MKSIDKPMCGCEIHQILMVIVTDHTAKIMTKILAFELAPQKVYK